MKEFVASPSDCQIGKCCHIESGFDKLKSLWNSANETVQCKMLVYIATDIKKKILEDFTKHFQSMKTEDGCYKPDFLENLNLRKYVESREKRLLSFLLGLVGEPLSSVGNKLPKFVSIIESIYNISLGAVMPFRFLIRYVLLSSSHGPLKYVIGGFHCSCI
jgi:hypothetical protein